MALNWSYWRANRQMSAKILELLQDEARVWAAARKIARRFRGASRTRFYTARDPFSGNLRIAGLCFKDVANVDKRLFCQIRDTTDGWRPRRGSKAGRALAQEFSQLRSEALGEIRKLLRLPDIIGNSTYQPAICEVDGSVYLATPVKPRGCRRVSDLEYERKTTAKKKRASTVGG